MKQLDELERDFKSVYKMGFWLGSIIGFGAGMFATAAIFYTLIKLLGVGA